MNDHTTTPADTRMMGIVHDALRRDLARVVHALSTEPYPTADQRVAIADHVGWLVRFLHAHHEGEDRGLWPALVRRDPSAAPVVAAMEHDHSTVLPLLDACEEAASAARADGGDGARRRLLAAVEQLAAVLLPHLRREEDEAMPLVARALTADDLAVVDREHFVGKRSFVELGFEGHWLLDGLDRERRQVVLHQVPLVPRLVLQHGFARRYRRHLVRCWGDAVATAAGPARSIPLTGGAEVTVAANPDAVWRVVTDVTRVGEWSHECLEVAWLDGATSAVPGSRFVGSNRSGPWTWQRENVVVAADAPHRFVWRTVPKGVYRDSTEWRIDLTPVPEGTRVTQTYELIGSSRLVRWVFGRLVPAHRDRSDGFRRDLERLGAVAASEGVAAGPART